MPATAMAVSPPTAINVRGNPPTKTVRRSLKTWTVLLLMIVTFLLLIVTFVGALGPGLIFAVVTGFLVMGAVGAFCNGRNRCRRLGHRLYLGRPLRRDLGAGRRLGRSLRRDLGDGGVLVGPFGVILVTGGVLVGPFGAILVPGGVLVIGFLTMGVVFTGGVFLKNRRRFFGAVGVFLTIGAVLLEAQPSGSRSWVLPSLAEPSGRRPSWAAALSGRPWEAAPFS